MAAFSAASYNLFLRTGASPSCSCSSSSPSPPSAGPSSNSLLASHANNAVLGSSSPAFTQLQFAVSSRSSASISHLVDDLVLHQNQGRQAANQMIAAAASATGLLSLEEAFQASAMKEDLRSHKSAGLESYMEHVRYCNSGSEHRSKFIPFVVDNIELGYIHPNFLQHLLFFPEVFIVLMGTEQHHSNGHALKVNGVNGIKAAMGINGSSNNGAMKGHANDQDDGVIKEEIKGLMSAKAINNDRQYQQAVVTLHPGLQSREARTEAVNRALKLLSDKGIIPGWRNEFYPVVKAFGTKSLFSLERAAVPYFGIKAYAIHMNGFVQMSNGEKYLWVARRSITKPTFPGMFDHLVAGGQPEGLSCKENVIKECDEEAGIPRSISERAKAVGAVSYEFIEGERFDRFILFCYDLELPADFIPVNKDGEVDSFTLVPVTKVARFLQTTRLYKPDCALVIIDFLFRHGYLSSDQSGYLELLQSLRKGDCI